MLKILLGLGVCASMYAAEVKPMDDWLKPVQEKADQGDQYSQLLLGRLYLSGRGLPQNFIKSSQLFFKSAKSGNSEAAYELGRLYERGCAFRQSFVEAAKWYRKAIEIDQEAKSQYCLAKLISEYKVKASSGENSDKLFLASYKSMQKMLEQGNEEAYFYLGKMSFEGWGIVRNARQGRDYFEAGSKANDAASQFEYAQFLLKGMLIEQDTKAGLKYLNTSSRASYAPATKLLVRLMAEGDMYMRVSPDVKQARLLEKQLADMGMADYQYEYSMRTLKFNPRDFRHFGFGYLENSAEQLYMPAEFKLAEIYLYGKYGLKQNVKRGMSLLRSAADGGYPKAKRMLHELTVTDK